MFSRFLNLPTEKQERILNAAIKEFAQKGYQDASTNEIVKEANISKGLLFHYFQNKKMLFLYVYDYCTELSMDEFYKTVDMSQADFFLRLRQVAKAKMELLSKHPEIFQFFQITYIEKSGEVAQELEERKNAILKTGYSKIFEGVDFSNFKEGLDYERVINIITWTMEGLSTSELERSRLNHNRQLDYDRIFAEGDKYISIFKECFYKE